MKQHIGKKKKDKVAAVLMLSFCLIALTSVFTVKANVDKLSKQADNIPVTKKTQTATANSSEKKAGTLPKEKKETAEVSTNIPVIDSKTEEGNSSSFIYPVSLDTGKMAKGYSVNMVIYNMTLDQYMTHPGIDIEAPAGTEVKAIADGTITDVYDDDAYGITIEITHDNGYISKYSNLSTDKMVEKGDTVSQGQVLSNVGKTALYECKDPAHLHFELLKDGKKVDPAEFLH